MNEYPRVELYKSKNLQPTEHLVVELTSPNGVEDIRIVSDVLDAFQSEADQLGTVYAGHEIADISVRYPPEMQLCQRLKRRRTASVGLPIVPRENTSERKTTLNTEVLDVGEIRQYPDERRRFELV